MARIKTPAALAASEIKKKLKANGIACKAKSSNFSMGSSVDINVQDLLPAVLEEVKSFCEQYEYGTFDAMTDCSGTKNRDFDGPQAKYVSVNCTYSDEIKSAAWLEARSMFSAMQDAPNDYDPQYYDYDHQRIFSNVLHDSKSAFWIALKPRIAA